jgi:diphosphomevalonate decarboxylase
LFTCVYSWGKRDTSLILPTNSSLSVTLSQDDLRSLTTARVIINEEEGASKDRLWLNGEEEEIKQGGRTSRCLEELRKLRKQFEVSSIELQHLLL